MMLLGLIFWASFRGVASSTRFVMSRCGALLFGRRMGSVTLMVSRRLGPRLRMPTSGLMLTATTAHFAFRLTILSRPPTTAVLIAATGTPSLTLTALSRALTTPTTTPFVFGLMLLLF